MSPTLHSATSDRVHSSLQRLQAFSEWYEFGNRDVFSLNREDSQCGVPQQRQQLRSWNRFSEIRLAERFDRRLRTRKPTNDSLVYLLLSSLPIGLHSADNSISDDKRSGDCFVSRLGAQWNVIETGTGGEQHVLRILRAEDATRALEAGFRGW